MAFCRLSVVEDNIHFQHHSFKNRIKPKKYNSWSYFMPQLWHRPKIPWNYTKILQIGVKKRVCFPAISYLLTYLHSLVTYPVVLISVQQLKVCLDLPNSSPSPIPYSPLPREGRIRLWFGSLLPDKGNCSQQSHLLTSIPPIKKQQDFQIHLL